MRRATEAMDDATLYFLREQGERAAAILDERERERNAEIWSQQFQAASSVEQLKQALVMSGVFLLERDAENRVLETYCGRPLAPLIAACPLPEHFDSLADVRRYMRRLDEYIYETQ